MLGPYNGILDNKQINYNFCFFDTLRRGYIPALQKEKTAAGRFPAAGVLCYQ